MSSLYFDLCLISRKIDHCTHCKTITLFPNIMIGALYPVLLLMFILFNIFIKDNNLRITVSQQLQYYHNYQTSLRKKNFHLIFRFLMYVHKHLLC